MERDLDALSGNNEQAVWGDEVGVTWENADDATKEKFAAVRLYWFFRMVDSGGPDGTDLDSLVHDEAREAAAFLGPILESRARMAGFWS